MVCIAISRSFCRWLVQVNQKKHLSPLRMGLGTEPHVGSMPVKVCVIQKRQTIIFQPHVFILCSLLLQFWGFPTSLLQELHGNTGKCSTPTSSFSTENGHQLLMNTHHDTQKPVSFDGRSNGSFEFLFQVACLDTSCNISTAGCASCMSFRFGIRNDYNHG